MKSRMCVDIGYNSLFKFGEQLCGDTVGIASEDKGNEIIVLADGLGSGVKANILSTLTAKIISTMMSNGLSVEECVATVAATLPVCETRGVAYSTFTILQIVDYKDAYVYQYDNPKTILLRNGKNYELGVEDLEIGEKRITKAHVTLEPNDTFILMSDGVEHAGIGATMNFGWERDEIIDYLETMYYEGYSSKTLATILLDKCDDLYGQKPGDDTTVAVVKFRERSVVNLMFGPPRHKEDDRYMLRDFFGNQGKYIIAGGTTSQIAARLLRRDVEVNLDYFDDEIPPTASLEGVDLVTEGVITISKVLSYAQDYLKDNESFYDWTYKQDGASQIARMLFEDATDIEFFVGKAINAAHQSPTIPINFSIKMKLIEDLVVCLEKMGKRVNVKYY